MVGILVINGIFCLLSFNILNSNVESKILIELFVFNRDIVILLNLMFNDVFWIKKFWKVFKFWIVLFKLVSVFEIIMDKIIVCLLFILVYLEVNGFNFIDWILKLSVVFFIKNYIRIRKMKVKKMLMFKWELLLIFVKNGECNDVFVLIILVIFLFVIIFGFMILLVIWFFVYNKI